MPGQTTKKRDPIEEHIYRTKNQKAEEEETDRENEELTAERAKNTEEDEKANERANRKARIEKISSRILNGMIAANQNYGNMETMMAESVEFAKRMIEILDQE